jgi:hypothetical protein
MAKQKTTKFSGQRTAGKKAAKAKTKAGKGRQRSSWGGYVGTDKVPF